MIRIERFLIAFAVIGVLWRMFVPPYDPLILCIGFISWAAWAGLMAIIQISPAVTVRSNKTARIASLLPVLLWNLWFAVVSLVLIPGILLYLLGWLSLSAHLLIDGGLLVVLAGSYFGRKRALRLPDGRDVALLRAFALGILFIVAIPLRLCVFTTPVLRYLVDPG